MPGHLNLFKGGKVLKDFLLQHLQLSPQDPDFIGDIDPLLLGRP